LQAPIALRIEQWPLDSSVFYHCGQMPPGRQSKTFRKNNPLIIRRSPPLLSHWVKNIKQNFLHICHVITTIVYNVQKHKLQFAMRVKSLLFAFACFALTSLSLNAQTARIQVIHNSADAAASTVDVWLDDGVNAPGILVDDFAFRTATPFVDAPAGTPITIGIAPGTSSAYTDTIVSFTVTLTASETYVIVANGIVSGSGYSPAPTFGLDIYAMGREAATNAANTDVLVIHGSTDAPAVDVVEVGAGAGTLVDGASYQDFAGYLELTTADYALQIRADYNNTTVAQFGAPLSTLNLAGEAITVVASGFLDPSMNSNGPAFGLYVALAAGGALVPLPTETISTARVNVIHNSADAAAAVVDVWLDNTLLLDDFAFRTSSGFVDAPAGVPFDVRIQPSNSTDTLNPIAKYTYTLAGGEKYNLVANGIVSASGYSPATPFDIYVYSGAQEKATMMGNTDVQVFHGSTDAPIVNVDETSVPAGTIVTGLEYGEFTGYLNLGTMDYTLAVIDSASGATAATFSAPLMTLNLQEEALTVLASGFLDPTQNSNGAGFGLWVALASGGALVELPVLVSAVEPVENGDFGIFPNPANNNMTLRYSMEKPGEVNVTVRDLTGRVMMSREMNAQGIGEQELNINVSELPAGTYMLELQNTSQRLVKKVQVLH
jgi:hypothetical protein